ncbi:hypothetical protein B566_EDAN001259 [Ephemera danica]|nr:hypothetical protein B566_EDAN001259 [Ephemera danica]
MVPDSETEFSEPAILRETRTRFVAPSAVRLPRAKRHMHHLVPLLLPGLFLGNVSNEAIEWSSDGEDDMDSEEMEAAGLLDSQELNWEIGGTAGSATTTLIPETVTENEEINYMELEWPGDFEHSVSATREAQARRMSEYMDTNVDPCTDFYQYACGRWASRHPIPRDKSGFDTFELLRERLDAQLRVLLEQEPTEPAESSVAIRKARDLYRSCMDYDSLTSRGSEPLLKLIRKLGGWPAIDPEWNATSFDHIRLMAELRRMNNDILIAQWVGPDIKHSEEYIVQITASPSERRNVSALYRRWKLLDLERHLPGIEWRRYLTLVLGYAPSNSEPIVVFAERYFSKLADLLSITSPRTVSNYLLWRFVRHRVGNLDERFQDVRQRFYCALFGREQSPPRWKDCVAQVNANMGMAVGALFVRRHFDENSKNDMQEAFRSLVSTSVWLDEETKTLSGEKVTAMTLRIGYPDFILAQEELDERYSSVNISRSAYFENMVALLRHASREERERLGSPVNKTQWNTAPAVVNAYYSRNKNQIMFPAGILQPPFYHRHFPRSLNFGGIGVVIGHEITHGFDDKGRLFDREGNMQRWWPEETIQNFHQRAQCLVDQYNRYTVDEVAMQVDGMSTQGENIADNGGIKQAFTCPRGSPMNPELKCSVW